MFVNDSATCTQSKRVKNPAQRPQLTFPNIVCFLFKSLQGPKVKKNWLPLSFGPAFAMATKPRRTKRSLVWNSSCGAHSRVKTYGQCSPLNRGLQDAGPRRPHVTREQPTWLFWSWYRYIGHSWTDSRYQYSQNF